MPLGKHALRIVRDELKLLFLGYMGGRLHNSEEGFVKFDQFAEWVAHIRPTMPAYIEEGLTLDFFNDLMGDFVHAEKHGHRG